MKQRHSTTKRARDKRYATTRHQPHNLSQRQWCLIICKICFYMCICTILIIIPYFIFIELNNKYISSYYTIHYTSLIENQPYNAKSSNVTFIAYIFCNIFSQTNNINTNPTKLNNHITNNPPNTQKLPNSDTYHPSKKNPIIHRFNVTFNSLYNISINNPNSQFQNLIRQYPICNKNTNNWNTNQVLGLFNTGTNALHRLLQINCPKLKSINKWWKHEYIGSNTVFYHSKQFQSFLKQQEIGYRYQFGGHGALGNIEKNYDYNYNSSYNYNYNFNFENKVNSHIIIVLIKDPLTWMKSICKASFEIKLFDPCPFGDKKNYQIKFANSQNFLTKESIIAGSLIDYWNKWYSAFIDSKFERIIVRFEDIVYNTKNMELFLCKCLIDENAIFDNYVYEAKVIGRSRNRISTLIDYADKSFRYQLYDSDALKYIYQHVNHTIVNMFGYQFDPHFHSN